ncbi:hypothetical protein BHE74_00022576 [Ensete ventricosum]|nr:hypothetical protein BHE74_00022576 [Ensete ventricosum]
MPPVTSCQGSRGTVRRSVAASALTRRLSPAFGGRGALVEGWSGTLALLCRPLLGEQLVGRRAARGYPEIGSGGGRKLDVTES